MNTHADVTKLATRRTEKPAAPAVRGKRTINLALQGGGAHGAFTWGVLDRLLEEDNLSFEGCLLYTSDAADE